jgi:outer membrane protein assembly factor BamB
VWGDRIFVTTAVSDDPNSLFVPGLDGRRDKRSDLSRHSWRVYGIDAGSGEILWEQEAHVGKPKIQRQRKNSYASPTPVTDGKHVVAWFGSEGLYCYDFEGKLLWKQDLGVIDAGASYDDTYDWGVASSPIIYRNLVIVLADGQSNSFIAAYDVATGERVWHTPRDVISSFSTPTIYEANRVEMVVNGADKMHGYDPLTGKQLWELQGSSLNTVPTPVIGHELIFIASGYRVKPIFAVRPGGAGDISLAEGESANAHVAWSSERDGPYLPTPIVYGEYLYTCQTNGVLACYRAETGEFVFRERIGAGGAFSASPIAADGKLFVASEEGDVYVIRAGTEYELLHTNPMGEVCMATPAVSKGRMFIRTQHHLFAVGDPSHP